MFTEKDWKPIPQGVIVQHDELPADGVPVLITDGNGNVALVNCVYIHPEHYFWSPHNVSGHDFEFNFTGAPTMYLDVSALPLPNGKPIFQKP